MLGYLPLLQHRLKFFEPHWIVSLETVYSLFRQDPPLLTLFCYIIFLILGFLEVAI
ncbi:hypothetical protein F2Q68_00007122 [Brassica cretica]|uniref:Uncharacterized protein n=1 Tax=Brassica cretica TaxID=69181 RepID=A0A8S9L1L7_BRACR|nr:hypothetical protein F2Q68_00007122 [Brassica cretica]